MITVNRNPSPREIRIFGLLWLLFFGLVGALSWFRPEALLGAATILGVAWLASLAFNSQDRPSQLLGVLLPALFGLCGGASRLGVEAATVTTAVGIVGALGAMAIWAAPSLGRTLYVGWMLAALPIGWTISNVILALVYFAVLTPIGLLLRVAGRDPMTRGLDPEASTYWIERSSRSDRSSYFRQF
ncbi:MAG: hypothetical protein GY716_22950 [bacterium]|nr:hypothetical protein [bacterium]